MGRTSIYRIQVHACWRIPRCHEPRYLLRDRDNIHGSWFQQRVKNMGVEEVLTAPHSSIQNPYPGRLNGSIPRERLDRTIMFGKGHLCYPPCPHVGQKIPENAISRLRLRLFPLRNFSQKR